MSHLLLYWIVISWAINQVFDMIEGAREAVFYHHINSREPLEERYNKWLHGFFMVARTIVGLLTTVPIGYLMYKIYDFWPVILYTASLMLSFTFMHDGAYYAMYNNLNPEVYKKRWKAQSKTSVAWTDKFMTYKIRMALYVLSIICLILCILILAHT